MAIVSAEYQMASHGLVSYALNHLAYLRCASSLSLMRQLELASDQHRGSTTGDLSIHS